MTSNGKTPLNVCSDPIAFTDTDIHNTTQPELRLLRPVCDPRLAASEFSCDSLRGHDISEGRHDGGTPKRHDVWRLCIHQSEPDPGQ